MKYYQPIKHRHSAQFKTNRSTYQFETMATPKPLSVKQMQAKIDQEQKLLNVWGYVRDHVEANIIPPNHNTVWVTEYVNNLNENIIKSVQKGYKPSFTDKQFALLSRLKADIETYKLALKPQKSV